jgi:hypothetical protein
MDAKARLSPQEKESHFSTPREMFFGYLRLGHPYFVISCFLSSAALIIISATSLWLEEDVLAGYLTIILLSATLILLLILAVCSASFNRRLEDWKNSQKETT